jgi:ppGpp synthetase/RelA/SpoT-type nucleotidyltranferase
MVEKAKLQIFDVIDETDQILYNNQSLYKKATGEITQNIGHILCDFNELLDIHARIKSSTSLKEKIIRNKLYKKYDTAEGIIDNLSDLIGIMVECRFNKNEVELFALIKKEFVLKNEEDGLYYNPHIPQMGLDLDEKQPQKQKNGHEIYRIDGKYIIDGHKVNFELQIKSLVNIFWSEIEHKIIYKNNVYIPNSGYIMEMLGAIKGNIVGIDKMLQLVNDQIQESSVKTSEANFDINFAIAKLISDTFIAKMSESIGFTVDFKRICDLISGYVLNKSKDLSVRDVQAGFLDLVSRVNEIYAREINWEQQLFLEEEYVGEDKFCQILGERLVSLMNTDFEWHIFFLMLFQIESDSNNLESFTDFMNNLKNAYSDKHLYKKLYAFFDEDLASQIHEDMMEFFAWTLSASASINIIENVDDESTEVIDSTIEYIVKNISTYEAFKENKRAIQMMILDKWDKV